MPPSYSRPSPAVFSSRIPGGVGNTAYVSDDFAPQFRDQHRSVNGRLLANRRVLGRDADGRPAAAVVPGQFIVQAEAAWIWSPYSERSYDSRYFGAVPLDGWVGLSRPIWVGEGRPRTGVTSSQNMSR